MMSKHKQAGSSPSSSAQGTLRDPYKDLDKYTRYFIIKAMQIIVQSRCDGSHKITGCKPTGNDWFNLNIPDLPEVTNRTKAFLNSECISTRQHWRVGCEITLNLMDGRKIPLEYWIITNRAYAKPKLKLSSSPVSPPLSSISDAQIPATHSWGAPKLNVKVPASSSNSRSRSGPFNNQSRNRLNSLGDSNSDASKPFNNVTNENSDIKPSTSCFALSSSQKVTNDHLTNGKNFITSPCTHSLNTTNDANNTFHDHQTPASNNSSLTSQLRLQTSHASITNKPSANSSIYTIYNKMSLLLKTLLSVTETAWICRFLSQLRQTDPCVICYRLFVPSTQSSSKKPSRNGQDNSQTKVDDRFLTPPLAGLDMSYFDLDPLRDDGALDDYHYNDMIGSVNTGVSRIEIALLHRKDACERKFLTEFRKLDDIYCTEFFHRILDADCLTAAKQLLAGNDYLRKKKSSRLSESNKNLLDRESSFPNDQKALDLLDQPLSPAFANTNNIGLEQQDRSPAGPGGRTTEVPASENELSNVCDLIEYAFDGLLKGEQSNNDDDLVDIASDALNKSPSSNVNQSASQNGPSSKNRSNSKSANARSAPIQVPLSRARNQIDHHSDGSTPKSSTDSFVFVDLHPPFASDEQNEINSFFHGPSPSFSNGSSNMKDVDDLTTQLATFEANAGQFDDFVDNICVSENDEDDREEEDDSREEGFHLCPKSGQV